MSRLKTRSESYQPHLMCILEHRPQWVTTSCKHSSHTHKLFPPTKELSMCYFSVFSVKNYIYPLVTTWWHFKGTLLNTRMAKQLTNFTTTDHNEDCQAWNNVILLSLHQQTDSDQYMSEPQTKHAHVFFFCFWCAICCWCLMWCVHRAVNRPWFEFQLMTFCY